MGRKRNGKRKRGLGRRCVKVHDGKGTTLGVLVLTRRFWWRNEPPTDSPLHSQWVVDTRRGKNWEFKSAGIGLSPDRKELLKYCSSEPAIALVSGTSCIGFDGKFTANDRQWRDVTLEEYRSRSATRLKDEPTPEVLEYRSLPKSQRTTLLAPRDMEWFYIRLFDSFKVREHNLIPVLEKLLENDIRSISLAGLRYALSQQ